MPRKNARPQTTRTSALCKRNLNSNTAAAQRHRFLAALRFGPVSTLKARRDLDILAPAARVLELRRQGYDIQTIWVTEPTACGRLHRVALYVLISSKGAK